LKNTPEIAFKFCLFSQPTRSLKTEFFLGGFSLALDLQDCAISTNGAKEFLNAAKYNSLIHIIDIRNNPLVDRDVMEKLIEQLLINCEDDRLCEVCI
jgi:hypothetical protein